LGGHGAGGGSGLRGGPDDPDGDNGGNGGNGGNGLGAGLYVAAGTVTLTNDTISANRAGAGSPGSAGLGGGGTPAGQNGSPGSDGSAGGGGLYVASAASVTPDSFTVAHTTGNTPDDIEGLPITDVSWINPAGGDWDTASNWSTGTVPDQLNHVTINLTPGITVTHNLSNPDAVNSLTLASADTLSIAKGSLTIHSASTLNGPFNLTGGTLWNNQVGQGTVTFNGALSWTDGGTMAGTGPTIATGAVTICSDGSAAYLKGSFTTTATATLGGKLDLESNAVFTNAAGATFTAATHASLSNQDGSTTMFSSAGNFTAQAGAGNTVTDSGVGLTTTGTLSVASGGFRLAAPMTWSGGTLDTTGGSFTSTGTITLSGTGTETLLGSFTNTAAINQTGSGTLQLGSGSTFTNASTGTIIWYGGTLNTTGGTFTNSGVIALDGGTLNTTGTNTGTFTWNWGTLGGTFTVAVHSVESLAQAI
jgi:hypothetical protein